MTNCLACKSQPSCISLYCHFLLLLLLLLLQRLAKETKWPPTDLIQLMEKEVHTRWRPPFFTWLPPWYQLTSGRGSAKIRHSNRNRFPSSSCLIDGFWANVGAIPSICLQQQQKQIYQNCQKIKKKTNKKTNYHTISASFFFFRPIFT